MDEAVEAAEEAVVGIGSVFGLSIGTLEFKIVYFCIIVLVAFIIQRVLVRLVKRTFDAVENLHSATIVTNFVRVMVWALALLFLLKPVFGVDPTAFMTTLGIGALLISLGLKDTISNIFGGFMLMAGRVIKPGDYVTIAGVTGTVVDITMRHTVVENRLEEHVVIPNSILNSTSIYRLPASSESFSTFEFTMEAGYDPDAVAEDIIKTVKAAAGDKLRDDMDPKVMFDSITPYGVKGQVFFYVNEGIPFAGVRNVMVRSLAQKEYFSLKGARALTGEAADEVMG